MRLREWEHDGVTHHVGSPEVEAYLAALPAPHRETMKAVRATLRGLLPDAQEGISYGAPALLLNGRPVAGYAAFAKHLTYLPHSGSVLAGLAGDLTAYRFSKGSLRFAVDQPLPADLVARLVDARLVELGMSAVSDPGGPGPAPAPSAPAPPGCPPTA